MKQIPLKDGEIPFEESIIVLSQKQIDKILNEAKLKTKGEWHNKGTKGVKVPLTQDQIKKVIEVKNEIVEGQTLEELRNSDLIDVLPHAVERAIERLEGQESKGYQEPLRKETYDKILKALIESEVIEKNAEWKGTPYLRYNFVSKVEENDIVISISFEESMLVITVIMKNRKGFFGSEHPEMAKLNSLFE